MSSSNHQAKEEEEEEEFDWSNGFQMNLSFYLTMHREGHSCACFSTMLKSYPWLTEFALHGDSTQEEKFHQEALSREAPPHFDKQRINTSVYLKSVIEHFRLKRLGHTLESAWDDTASNSTWSVVVLRATVFRSQNDEELRANIQMLIEVMTIKAMHEWVPHVQLLKSDASEPMRRFFWCILHYYKVLKPDFDETINIKLWDRTWLNQALRTAPAPPRTAVSQHIQQCERIMKERPSLVNRHDALVKSIRSSILQVSKPIEISILRDMLLELRGSRETQALLLGLPMPPFELEKVPSLLRRLEKDKHMMDFINDSLILVRYIDPIPSSFTGWQAPESDAGPLQTATLSLFDAPVRAQKSPQEKAQDIVAEIGAITQQLSECAAEVRDLVLACEIQRVARRSRAALLRETLLIWRINGVVVAPAARIRDDLLLLSAEQHRLVAVNAMQERAVGVADEIRRLNAELAPLFVEQMGLRAVHEQRQRATGAAEEISALMEETARIGDLLRTHIQVETELGAQHERRRQFLETAARYLPQEMVEASIECGICFNDLVWHSDMGIGFVVCCPGIGYICSGCKARPHRNHPLVAEQEIVRIVRCVRRDFGI